MKSELIARRPSNAKPSRLQRWLALTTAMLMSTAAPAALIDRGGGMVYDTTLDITWLSDWNQARTSGLSVDGRMHRSDANDWAQSLVHGGYDDWRLPSTAQPDASCSDTFDPGFGHPLQYLGFNCTGSEMGHLFYADLGGKAGESVHDPSGDTALEIANVALFTNMAVLGHWSGTVPDSFFGLAWYFSVFTGEQSQIGGNGISILAVAVRRGDVATSVPEPQSLTLLLLALGATVVARKWRPRQDTALKVAGADR